MMKVYVTARYMGAKNKSDIELLCTVVRNAGFDDFCFIRDVEQYQKTFNNITELWKRTKEEIQLCDALLVDVTDSPTGGRVVEVGIAFGLDIPIITLVKTGVDYKELYNGVSSIVIRYTDYADITRKLQDFRKLNTEVTK